MYEQLAELHKQQGDNVYAQLFYEKAFRCTTDPALGGLYQLEIES